jgi:hypothetical protein
MVMGDTMYIAGMQAMLAGGPKTVVMAMDADISPNDPYLIPVKLPNSIAVKQLAIGMRTSTGMKANPHFRWPSGEGITSLNDLRRKIEAIAVPGIATGLVGSEGMLVLCTDVALRVFERSATIIADSGRLLEVDSEGFPTLSMDSTLAGQPYQQPAGNAVTVPAMKATKLVQPTKVYRVSPTELLVVDTGSNRVVRMSRAGFEARSITDFTVDGRHKPLGYRPGDSTSLRQPRDVFMLTDFVPTDPKMNPFSVTASSGMEYWVHYLIADTGNNRVVELVDRYEADPATRAVLGTVTSGGQQQVGQLLWVSPAAESGKTYAYTAAQRVPTGTVTVNGNDYPVYSYVMAFGNVSPERASYGLDMPNGTVPRETAAGGGGLLVQGANRIHVVNKLSYYAYDAANGYKQVSLPIRDPVSMETRPSLSRPGEFEVLLATADGVFVARMPALPSDASDTWQCSWVMTNDDYALGLRGWRGAAAAGGGGHRFPIVGGWPLRAAGARWLPNGDVMITNSWSGRLTMGGNGTDVPASPQFDFFGEVFVVNSGLYQEQGGAYHGWLYDIGDMGPSKIKRSIPPLQDTGGLRQPQFAERPY